MYTPINFKKALNNEQFEAVITQEGPVLVIASAGTGKTTVLKYRTARLLEMGTLPENLLLLTFTNKAANEMKERIHLLLGEEDEDADKITACTYHSFCALILRKYASFIGLKNNYTIIDSSDSIEAIKIVIEEYFKQEKDLPKTKDLGTIFSNHRNMEKSIEEIIQTFFPNFITKTSIIKKIYEKYSEYKLDKNILDYDDLLVQMNGLLEINPNICKQLSDTYKYIMVDEYQDSNKLQFKMLKLLRQFDNKNLMVVGDEGQCLYSWRGAEVDHIINFPKEFKDCKIIKLEQNYRSSEEILEVANSTIKCFNTKFDRELKAQFKQEEKPAIILTEDKNREAEYIARKINQLVKKGEDLSDIAVLIRASRNSAKLEILLNQYGIPFTKYGGLKFLERQFVKDILSFLKILVNESDEIAWFRILQLYPNIGTFYAKKISSEIIENGIDILISDKYKKSKVLYTQKFEEIYKTINLLKTMSLKEQLEYLVNLYYFNLIEEKTNSSNIKQVAKNEILQENKENKEQAKVLFDLATSYKTTLQFLTEITLEPPTTLGTEKDLTVSTIHSAKGLEFKYVFIMDCIEGSLPGKSKAHTTEQEKKDLEEERRIFYVACTRAKKYLYLMYPQNNIDYYGNFYKNELSRFVTENNNIKNFDKFRY